MSARLPLFSVAYLPDTAASPYNFSGGTHLMTYKEVLSDYNEYIIPIIQRDYEKDGVADTIARREAWNNFTDSLRKDGAITNKQYETWECPW